MKFKFSDLWRLSGTIDRGPYALVGFVGFAIKHNLDRLLAYYVFGRPWTLFNYWLPLRDATRITSLQTGDATFLATMVLLALPFIWIGTGMTLKRLRSASLPTPLVLLFFIPYFNLLFLLLLCVVPARDSAAAADEAEASFLRRVVPKSALGSAAMAVLVTLPLGLGTVYLLTEVFAGYGSGLFLALPFTMGLVAALIYGVHEPRTVNGCIKVASLSVALLGLALLALAAEGVICLIMAAPVALAFAAFGAVVGHSVRWQRWLRRANPAFLSAMVFLAPSVQWMEHAIFPVPPVYEVQTSIDIQAPPEEVWQQVVAFSEIPPPREWMFRFGIAYPMRAEILGKGPGAERHCEFSTGTFVEPVQVWDEPRLLKFSVTSNPGPMEEWTPYHHIDPPHLHGYLVSNGGQFLLTALPNGGTRVEGTTWYRHSLWPAPYWRLWSDAIIHKIHWRVLSHIRDVAEHRAT